ncbi:MAG TPA: hypothetical protein GXZ24_02200 [Firmicutes bacterium]|jgi:predicted phosphodiesterase|nr:hypothetical protein [Bacillota bacterium]
MGPVVISTEAFEFETCLRLFGDGSTIIHLPPLGKLTTQTHLPPFDLHFTLKYINLREFSNLLGNSYAQKDWFTPFLMQVKGSLIRYLVFFLVLAFFLGVGFSLLSSRQGINKKEMGLLGLVNVLFLVLIMLFMAGSYNLGAFAHVEYQGIIEAAPLVLNALEKGIDVVDNFGAQAAGVVENISILHDEIGISTIEEGDPLKVLHVSDIHNNPAALDFIRSIIETFEVDLIIDTGDLVDYGTIFEAERFATFFAQLNIPYLFIPGNHESPQVVAYLEGLDGVTVLDEGIIEVAGLKIAAMADPSSSFQGASVADEWTMGRAAQKFAALVKDGEPVDIIAAHNSSLFRYLRENGRLFLCGHLHRAAIEQKGQYVEVNAGSTGASGIRGLRDLDLTFSLVLLTFQHVQESSALSLYSADMIKIEHAPLHYSLERILFNNPPSRQETVS